MPLTDILEKNCRLYGDDVCLVEINPEMPETRRVTWKEFELIEPVRAPYYRREITWNVFNEKANRFANLLLERGVKKGDKVAILLMNCLEWLPIYFGILKAGALAVPLNFRYSAEEIQYCLDLAEVDILVFGPEFIGRVEEVADEIGKHRLLYYVGDGCPGFAEDYTIQQTAPASARRSMWMTMTMQPFIFPPVQPDFQKQSSTPIRRFYTRQNQRSTITIRQKMMSFCASRHFITQVQKCTGSAVF